MPPGPDDTIRANILANYVLYPKRVYTEWYRNKGKDYTTPPPTATTTNGSADETSLTLLRPHCRRTFRELSIAVLTSVSQFLPVLRRRAGCSADRGWMNTVGKQSGFGDQGYSAIEILRYFYGKRYVYQCSRRSLPGFLPPGQDMTWYIECFSGSK